MSRQHILYDIWLHDVELLKWVAHWESLLVTLAQQRDMHILTQHFHQFEPWGVTGFLLLSESHISVHTWSEYELATLDIFACGEVDLDGVIQRLRQHLSPYREKLVHVERGET